MSAASHVTGRALDALQSSGGEFQAVVNGRSMGLALPPGSVIRVAPLGANPTVTVGEIVVQRGFSGDLTVHRVVATGTDLRGLSFVITQGDSQTLCDMPINPRDIMGTVIAVRNGQEWAPLDRTGVPTRSLISRLVSLAVLRTIRSWAHITTETARKRFSSALSSSRSS